MASPSATQVTRRRQRSIRVTTAVGLIVLAALVVAGAAVSGSWLLVTIAAGLGVLLGAAATRITHTELVASRVSAARDRATQAKAFNELSDQRSAEHAAYVDEVRARLSDRAQALGDRPPARRRARAGGARAPRRARGRHRRLAHRRAAASARLIRRPSLGVT